MKWLWGICGLFMATGATWLVTLIWSTSHLQFAPAYAPQVIGAVIVGLTLARALDRRMHAMLLSAAVTAAWIALELVAFELHDAPARWSGPCAISSWASYGVIALVAIPAAALAAWPRLRGRADHPMLWLWISSLLMLGTFLLPLMLLSNDQKVSPAGALVVFVAPFVTGAITQLLAPYRALWACGGGAIIYLLILFERLRDAEPGAVLGSILGVGTFVLLGALGAAIGWRLFRNKDPRTPVRAELPTATAN